MRWRALRRADPAWAWLPHLLMGMLAVPFIVRQNSWYEWANSLWLLELQTTHVAAHGLPTYFIDSAGSYFYPHQLFYAGPMLSVLAYPALIVGPWAMYAAAAAAAFVAASAGISWTARSLGVPPALAIVPGVLFAATPYTVSNLYGRGDWAELLATGFLALALGAATSLLTDRARSVPAVLAGLALSVAGIAGTHNLTLLFGALLAPLLRFALLPLLPGSSRAQLRRYGLVVAGAIIGLALCGVFLIPNVWLSARTNTATGSFQFLTQLHSWDRPGMIFDLLPGQPSNATDTDLHTQTLVVALVWCLGALALAAVRGWLGRAQARAVATLCLTGIGIAILITNPTWWESFPHLLTVIQFPFRLVTFLALVTVIVVAVLLAIPAVRRSRGVVAALLLATAWQLGLAGYLAVSAQPHGTRIAPTPGNVQAGRRPPSFAKGQRVDFRLVVANPLPRPAQQASVAPVGDDAPPEVRLYGSQPVGSLVATRVVASPLISFRGDVTVVGATHDGLDVVRVNRTPWQSTVQSVCETCLGALTGGEPVALLAGRAASLLGALALLTLIVVSVRARTAAGRPDMRSHGQR